MALSNIFKEPRRELTETAVGLVIITITAGLYAAIVYTITVYLIPPDELFLGHFAMVGIGLLCVISLTFWSLFIIHCIGEDICDALDKRGIRLRSR